MARGDRLVVRFDIRGLSRDAQRLTQARRMFRSNSRKLASGTERQARQARRSSSRIRARFRRLQRFERRR